MPADVRPEAFAGAAGKATNSPRCARSVGHGSAGRREGEVGRRCLNMLACGSVPVYAARVSIGFILLANQCLTLDRLGAHVVWML